MQPIKVHSSKPRQFYAHSNFRSRLLITGNNIYGEDIRHTLLNNPENRSQYILMDRIQPTSASKNVLVRQELTSICPVDVISELGIVGVFIRLVSSMTAMFVTQNQFNNQYSTQPLMVTSCTSTKMQTLRGCLLCQSCFTWYCHFRKFLIGWVRHLFVNF